MIPEAGAELANGSNQGCSISGPPAQDLSDKSIATKAPSLHSKNIARDSLRDGRDWPLLNPFDYTVFSRF